MAPSSLYGLAAGVLLLNLPTPAAGNRNAVGQTPIMGCESCPHGRIVFTPAAGDIPHPTPRAPVATN